MQKAIIIGAGPAGISASLYTKRAKLNTLVIHNNDSTLKYAKKIDNYYGLEESISGDKLYENGKEVADLSSANKTYDLSNLTANLSRNCLKV